MTEAEWLACDHSMPMLRFLDGKGGERKLRLFTLGCCRRIEQLLPDSRCRKAIDLVDAFAEAKTERRDLRIAEGAAEYYRDHPMELPEDRLIVAGAGAIFQLSQDLPSFRLVAEAASDAVECSILAAGGNQLAATEGKRNESATQIKLLRCIIGNPFRPVTLDLSWQTANVVALAQGIYADRAFDRLPILADALEDAGCTERAILDHCRQPGEHVRGCWVVDLVLGKS